MFLRAYRQKVRDCFVASLLAMTFGGWLGKDGRSRAGTAAIPPPLAGETIKRLLHREVGEHSSPAGGGGEVGVLRRAVSALTPALSRSRERVRGRAGASPVPTPQGAPTSKVGAVLAAALVRDGSASSLRSSQ